MQQSVLPVPLPPLTAFDLFDLKGQKNRSKKIAGSDKKKALKLQILKEGDFSRKIIFTSLEHDQTFRSQLKKDLQVRLSRNLYIYIYTLVILRPIANLRQFLADDECIEYSFLLGVHTDALQVTLAQEKQAKVRHTDA